MCQDQFWRYVGTKVQERELEIGAEDWEDAAADCAWEFLRDEDISSIRSIYANCSCCLSMTCFSTLDFLSLQKNEARRGPPTVRSFSMAPSGTQRSKLKPGCSRNANTQRVLMSMCPGHVVKAVVGVFGCAP